MMNKPEKRYKFQDSRSCGYEKDFNAGWNAYHEAQEVYEASLAKERVRINGAEEIKILKLMIKHYDKRGGGYLQKKALKFAIKAIECRSTEDRLREALEDIKKHQMNYVELAITTEVYKIAKLALKE